MVRRLLIVSPDFHGYWRAVAAAFESIGFSVSVHRYDSHSTVVDRVRNKLQHELPEAMRSRTAEEKATLRAVEHLGSERFDAVLVIKGDQLGDIWWESLGASGVRSATWLYDEIRRTRYTPEFLAATGPVASYSHDDVRLLNEHGAQAAFVPLGFDASQGFSRVDVPAVTLVGARYPNRERLVRDIQDSGIPVRAYGRDWSRKLTDVARTRRFRSAGVPASGDLARDGAYGVMAGSLATLNVHADQDGFTMRTFEAAGVGGLELVDRADVHEFYDVGEEVLVFDTVEEIVELARRAQREPSWAAGIREAGRKRTLAEHTLMHRARSLEALWV
ncbi:glycosyltransferase [Pseudoclavibacter sp. RFBA6]|uniref:CgeB family protein n=1 Tax=Pseudoclavibacter sp. RFBA6 TaxID=2080573 RepID=UPI000CE8C70E|nr:glycosyltransferase [Pseudoclavibacter sp. RFBA6]PPG42771.1 spore maturation protein [Pseudoclavibacter sp. RFBA6]